MARVIHSILHCGWGKNNLQIITNCLMLLPPDKQLLMLRKIRSCLFQSFKNSNGVARVVEVGGKQGASVGIRGARVYASPKGQHYIDKRSRAAQGPQQLRHFRQPQVASESSNSVHFEKEIYNCNQVSNTLTSLTVRSWYRTQDPKKDFNAIFVPHFDTKLLLLFSNNQVFPNET